jgi:hypothetical protein
MSAQFIHVRCPECKQDFRTSAGADKNRMRLLMPLLKLLHTRCPHCHARMFIGEAQIVSPVGWAKQAS